MKNTQVNMHKMNLAIDLIKVINTMANQGEDYSLIQRTYNDLIEEYNLPLMKIIWISHTKFEFKRN